MFEKECQGVHKIRQRRHRHQFGSCEYPVTVCDYVFVIGLYPGKGEDIGV